jgi:hypothetical protein
MATRQTVREEIQWQADVENWAGASSTQLNLLIQRAYDEAWNILVDTFEGYANKVSSDFTLAGGISGNTYALSNVTDLLKPISLQKQWGSRWGDPISRLEAVERGCPNERSWRIDGGTLYVEPYETAAGTYRLWYAQKQTAFTADNDAVQDPTNGAVVDYMIAWVCAKIRTKQELDTAAFDEAKKEFAQKVRMFAADRISGQPRRVGDARGALRGRITQRTRSGIPPY